MTVSLYTSIQPQFRTVDGLSIRYAESENPGRGVDALLLSPWPESLYAFEPTWSRLAEHRTRQWAPSAKVQVFHLPALGSRLPGTPGSRTC
jgi:hypothetical protein